jgi:hypothetical protein
MKQTSLAIVFSLLQLTAWGQFAPQAGVTGSTAIPASSPLIKSWAASCSVNRGYIDIAQPGQGYVSAGDTALGIGSSDGFIVSLGDSGTALLSFVKPIYDGPGPDFVVFENGFPDPVNPNMAFLELAFVEVSSDGINFFRFPATSNSQLDSQVAGAGVYMDASRINNLAGKYIGSYGTPFDLQELSGTTGLDVNQVRFVRLVDVIGSITGQGSVDNMGQRINDPYPTNFPTGGFDLDAVGVINEDATGIAEWNTKSALSIFPNPATDRISINASIPGMLTVSLTDLSGKVLLSGSVSANDQFSLECLRAGVYFLTVSDARGNRWVERVIKL